MWDFLLRFLLSDTYRYPKAGTFLTLSFIIGYLAAYDNNLGPERGLKFFLMRVVRWFAGLVMVIIFSTTFMSFVHHLLFFLILYLLAGVIWLVAQFVCMWVHVPDSEQRKYFTITAIWEKH